jgi:hypothetical protein
MSMAITSAPYADVFGVLRRAMVRGARQASATSPPEPQIYQCYAVYSGALSPLEHKSLRRRP